MTMLVVGVWVVVLFIVGYGAWCRVVWREIERLERRGRRGSQ